MTDVRTPIRRLHTDFRAGEISPSLYMRVDSKAYPSGAYSLRNCIIRNTGSVERRPGTSFLANLGGETRLLAFEFDENERYVLAFQNGVLKIYTETGDLLQTLSSQPWDATTMWELTVAQVANTAFICHKTFAPRRLLRTSLTTFSMSTFSFYENRAGTIRYQPYYKFEDQNVTLTISSTAVGSGRTVTASSAIFSSDWVGKIIRIHRKEVLLTAYTSTTVMTGTVRELIEVELDENPLRTKDGTQTIEVTHVEHGFSGSVSVTLEGIADFAGIAKGNMNGTRTCTVLDDNRYEFTTGAGDNADNSIDGGGPVVKVQSTAATTTWDEQAFSDHRGWPGAVCLHEDRLWFGGSSSLPDALFSSRTGRYTDFDIGEGEDDRSIQLYIGSTMVPAIKHLVSNRTLNIFSEASEYVAAKTEGAGLTPSNVSVTMQTPYGVSKVQPRNFDGATLFVQRAGKSIREFVYDLQSDGYSSPDLTTLSAHLINQPVDMDVLYGSATRAEQYAFLVNADGTLAVFHSVRNEQLAAWVPWDTGTGLFKSVVVVGTTVYFAVLRGAIWCLEKLQLDSDVTMDCSIILSGASSATWDLRSGLEDPTATTPHNGAEMHSRSGDFYLGQSTASAYTYTSPGSIAVTSIQIGFNYDFEIIPVPPDTDLADGAMTGEKRRVSAAIIHVLDALNLTVDGRQVCGYTVGFSVENPPDRMAGKSRYFLSGWDRDPVVTLSQSAPMPVTVLGMVLEVSI